VSKFKRLVVASVLRSSKRMGPETLIVKEATARVVEDVVTALPAWVQVLPLFVEYQMVQVLLASVAYLACLTLTVAR